MNNKLSPERYLLNKEHFDEGLIAALENQYKQNDKLKKDIDHEKVMKKYWQTKYEGLVIKCNDLKAVCYNLSNKKKNNEKDIEYLRKCIKDLNIEISDSLKQAIDQISELQEENSKLKDEIEKYKYKEEKQKKKNASNSNIPTSYEVIKAEANSRVKSNKQRGGQKGHTVHRSVLKKNPDKIIKLVVKEVPTGAIAVNDENNNVVYYATQEIDASLETKVIETRYYIDKENGDSLEKRIKDKYRINSVTYGTHFKSQILYLTCKGTIPFARLCEIINSLSGGEIEIQPSTIVNWLNEFNVYSAEYRKEILSKLLSSWVLNVDETGYRVNGKNHWMHAICNEESSYYVLTKKRKDTERGPLYILQNYEGTLVHDHLKSYYDLNCHHSECAAHIIRYLKAGIDFEGSSDCGKMLLLMQKMIHRKNELISKGINEMDSKEIEKYTNEYEKIIKTALDKYEKENPKAKKSDAPESIKLLRRMLKYETEHLRFINDFDVPATNNLAEKMMRSVMPHKRISKQSINETSANNYASLLTVVQTANMSNKNALEEIEKIMSR